MLYKLLNIWNIFSRFDHTNLVFPLKCSLQKQKCSDVLRCVILIVFSPHFASILSFGDVQQTARADEIQKVWDYKFVGQSSLYCSDYMAPDGSRGTCMPVELKHIRAVHSHHNIFNTFTLKMSKMWHCLDMDEKGIILSWEREKGFDYLNSLWPLASLMQSGLAGVLTRDFQRDVWDVQSSIWQPSGLKGTEG